MHRPKDILILCDDSPLALCLQILLEDDIEDSAVTIAGTDHSVKRGRLLHRPRIVIADVDSEAQALSLVSTLRRRWSDVPVLLLTAHHAVQIRTARARLRNVAVLSKPLDPGPFIELVQQRLY